MILLLLLLAACCAGYVVGWILGTVSGRFDPALAWSSPVWVGGYPPR